MQLKLQEWQKWLAAISSALLLVTIIVGVSQWISNPNFRNFIQNVPKKGPVAAFIQNDDDLALKKNLKDLDDKLNKLSENDSFYQTIKLADLPIYPESWVGRNFEANEKTNLLISGSIADPDGDGLSNKEEYFLGSNPKKADSLCATSDGKPAANSSKIICDGSGNDQKYVKAGISPLTGLDLETPQSFRLLKQDLAIIQGIQSSFETASSEGVDFPVLYQLSKKIDLNKELEQISVREVSDNAQNIIDYRTIRLELLQESIGQNETSSLSQVYQAIKVEQLQALKAQYQSQIDKLNKVAVPTKMLITHRSYFLIIQKLIALIDHRISGIQDNKLKDVEFGRISQQKAVEIVWGYRVLSELGAKDEELN